MIHRLCSITLSSANFNKELNRIYNKAELNGYTKTMIDNLLKKHKNQVNKKLITSLEPVTEKIIRCPNTYHSSFHKLRSCFIDNNVQLIPTSKTKPKNLLLSTKDSTPKDEKSCVYLAKCSSSKCNTVYIGQTARTLKIRLKEHLKCIENNDRSSAIVEHVLDLKGNHKFDKECFELL